MLDENSAGTVVADGEGSPKRRGGRPKGSRNKGDTSQLESGQLLELMFQKFSEMNDQTQKNFMAAIAEMKKPSVREQMQIDKENEIIRRKAEGRVAAAKIETERKENQRKNCSHTMPPTIPGLPGRHAWVGQVCSDGYAYPFCNICHYGDKGELKFKATPHMLQNGLSLPMMTNVNLEALEKWARQHA